MIDFPDLHGFGSQALVIGASLSAAAAVAHLACIVIGPRAYRFMGAGERMVRGVEAGKLRPTLVTVAIAFVLFVWSAYALSGAGVIPRLPLTRLALVLICAAYLARAVGFPLLKPVFPENSNIFWVVSSAICGVLGLVYLYGTISVWHTLAEPAQPAWLRARIAQFEQLPPANPPRAVLRTTYAGLPAYFVTETCCDIPGELYDEAGQLLCYPTGGFAGGDGRCPSFALPPNSPVLWRDGRALNGRAPASAGK